jgi:hypothetical protein
MVRHVKPGAAEELVEPVAGLYDNVVLNQDSSIGIFILLTNINLVKRLDKDRKVTW